MGRVKKGHVWKTKHSVVTKIDRSDEQKIDVDIADLKKDEYDDCNALVLPSKKRATKSKATQKQTVKRLSKKQRKKLEKIVEQKDKKIKRSELLEKLQTVQVTPDELQKFTSISQMYSGKTKRTLDDEVVSDTIQINALNLSGRKRKKLKTEEPMEDESSSSSDQEETDEEEDDLEDEEDVEELEENVIAHTIEKSGDTDTGVISRQEQNDNNKEVSVYMLEDGRKPTDCSPVESKPAVHIPLNRKAVIQEQRLQLPILGEEQVIMEAISENPVVVLCGETGSGKTTQVPQFLYEAGYAHREGCIIGVTEPRRVAAISMSKRVAQEMNLSQRVVSYQIRYEANVTDDTKIKFMTDGVLLKEVQKDFMLTKYKAIIIDEAHERSVYTDILIGLLSRIVPFRQKKGNPLKLIIMSATLRVEDFTENQQLFKITPPVIKIDARQFPVTVHFNKRTPVEDYLGEAYKKVCKIHRQLPEGGILVFVTGQQEVHTLCAKLRKIFPLKKGASAGKETSKPMKKMSKDEDKKISLPDIKLEDYSIMPLDEEAELDLSDSDFSDDEDDAGLEDKDDNLDSLSVSRIHENEQALYVLPLYSLLPAVKQAKVFDPPPEGSRLCIVATNVAETSLTIPDVKYVIDTGKVKTKFYDKVTGVSTFRITWTSKASANQRAGRSGRTGPGHCYRLYSSAVFNDEFDLFSEPEITRRPVDDLVLQMKDMLIDKVVNFPFPTPPSAEALKAAERLLISLGALEKPPMPKSYRDTQKVPSSKITPLGRAMACFPVAPRYGKMLSLGHQHQLLPYVVAMVAALSVQELFVQFENPPTTEEEKEEQKRKSHKSAHLRRTWAGVGNSLLLGDLMVLLKAVGAWEYSGGSMEFCESHGLRYKAMVEIRKLRAQLTNTVNSVIPDADVELNPQMKPPTDLQAKLLRQIVLAGLGDNVAMKLSEPPKGTEDAKTLKYAYQSMLLEDPVFIHPGSVLFRNNPLFVVYQSVVETSKLYMKGVSVVEADWLPLFVANHCQFDKPAEEPSPRFDQSSGNVVCHMTSSFGPNLWPLPAVEVEYPEGLDRYKWFARFFLEGNVCPKISKFTPTLLTTPVTMIKSWAKLQPRTERFLNTLVSVRVDSKTRLEAVWKKNPTYLQKTYSEWIPGALHADLQAMWPPL